MSRKFLILTLTLVLCIFLPTTAAFAAPAPDKIVGDGETHRGELTLFGDNLLLNAGGTVAGDVVVMGGNATLDGSVTGDLVIFGGNVTINTTATVDGDCIIFGGKLTNNGGTHNCTSIGENFADFSLGLEGLNFDPLTELQTELNGISAQIEPNAPQRPNSYNAHRPSLLSRLIWAVTQAVGTGFLALIVTALFPNNIQRISQTVRHRPVISGTVGLVTSVASISLMLLIALVSLLLIIICIGLLGFPVLFSLGAVLGLACFAGWISIGLLLGEKLVPYFHLDIQSTAAVAALGTATLTLLMSLIGTLPTFFGGFIEPILSTTLMFIGLGAATLTQLGRQNYPANQAPPANPGKVADAMDNMPFD